MEFNDKLEKVFTIYDKHVKDKRDLEVLVDGLVKTIQIGENEKQVIEDSWSALRILLDKFSSDSIDLLNDMLNKGVKSIFHDRDYSIEIEITDKKRKSMKLYLVEKRNNQIIKALIPDGIGGGVLVVVSFIFQVFLIRLYELRPFMLIDEGFTNIATPYLENFFKFIKYLISEMGFAFLMVSHDVRFDPYFDKIYEVNMGNVNLLKNK